MTSGEGLDRETDIFKICGPSEGRADGQWKLQSLKLNILDLLPSPNIILREATLSRSKLLYAERSIAGRALEVLVGAYSGNVELEGAGSQTTNRNKVSCIGSREEIRQPLFHLFLGSHLMVERTAAVP